MTNDVKPQKKEIKTEKDLTDLRDEAILSLDSSEIPIDVLIQFIEGLYATFDHPLPLRRGASTHSIGDANKKTIGTTTHGHTAFTLIFLQRHFLPTINSLQATIEEKNKEINALKARLKIAEPLLPPKNQLFHCEYPQDMQVVADGHGYSLRRICDSVPVNATSSAVTPAESGHANTDPENRTATDQANKSSPANIDILGLPYPEGVIGKPSA